METRTDLAATSAFNVGDFVVHPAHGAGQILEIEHRDAGGKRAAYYVLKILESGTKIMVAVLSADAGGLRPIMSQSEATAVLHVLRTREVATSTMPWNRRHRLYTEMLKSGSPFEIAKVLRDMGRLSFDKDLSFAERKLLDQAKAMLLHELALAQGLSREAMEGELKGIIVG